MKNPQHEYEITELILAARPEAVRRGYQVGRFNADAEMKFGSQLVFLERERSRKDLDRVKERIGKYGYCTDSVCWIVDTEARIKNIIQRCKPPPNHFFATYKDAINRWHDATIWHRNSQETP